MILSDENVFEFAMPDAFIAMLKRAQSNAAVLDCAVANSAMEELEDVKLVSLFTVTEQDFIQMARFYECLERLRELTRGYISDTSKYIHMMQIGPRQQRGEAMFIHQSLGACMEDIDRCERRYFELCRKMKNFCVKIDEITKWYIAAVDEVVGLLNYVAAAGGKYSNLANAFKQAGKDVGAVEMFFDKWSEMVTNLAKESQAIGNEFREHYEYCNNELPKKVQSIPITMDNLNSVIKQNQFVQFFASMSARYNDAMHMTGFLNGEIQHVSLPALNNMVVYLGHIGTYYDGIVCNIKSTKSWLLSVDDVKFVRTAVAQLTNSKDAWLACEDASQRFVNIAGKFIR